MKTVTHSLLQIQLTLLIVAAALALYEHHIARPRLRIGVVDVAAVYRQKESEFTRLVTQGQNEEQRDQALQLARHFARRLPAALEQLPRDCQCLVVVRSAIAGNPPQAIDLTPRLRRQLEAR